MNELTILTDYKNRFVSKYHDTPYRSGMDKNLLKEEFLKLKVEMNELPFSEVDFRTMDFQNRIVLYTSSEDGGYHYKSYIEDIILGFNLQGAHLYPSYKYLRANNNKVFMEILRDLSEEEDFKNIQSYKIGVVEDLNRKKDKINNWQGTVIKPAAGAMSNGVTLADSYKDVVKKSKTLSKTKNFLYDVKDIVRKYYYPKYECDSKYRKKFIVQNFIPKLKNDWKVLVFYDKYYIFERPVRKNDFRASGSGHSNYLFGSESAVPEGIFDFAKKIFNSLDEPIASLDILFDGEKFYCSEFQMLHFGTVGQVRSDCYFSNQNGKWEQIYEKIPLERVYADSIVKYMKDRKLFR